jgi:hypothetical protein
MSCPSSPVYVVSGRAVKSGALAIHTLREPFAFCTQATWPPDGAAAISDGNGAESSASSVTCCCAAAGTATSSARSVNRRII